MSTSKPRGQYAKGAERREQIIQTATDVFATEGFEGTALKRVAELVGVKEATLFHYFRGKQELLTAVLAERDRRSLAAGRPGGSGPPAVAPSPNGTAQEPGLTTLYAVASATANDPGHDSHPYFQERYAQVVEELAEDIARRQEAGEVRRGRAREEAGPAGGGGLRRPPAAVALRQECGHGGRPDAARRRPAGPAAA